MAFPICREDNFVRTPDNGRNAVLISEDEWRGIQETLYLNSIPGLAESIMEAAQTPVDACVPEEDVEW